MAKASGVTNKKHGKKAVDISSIELTPDYMDSVLQLLEAEDLAAKNDATDQAVDNASSHKRFNL